MKIYSNLVVITKYKTEIYIREQIRNSVQNVVYKIVKVILIKNITLLKMNN
jgi:hypothetical protein